MKMFAVGVDTGMDADVDLIGSNRAALLYNPASVACLSAHIMPSLLPLRAAGYALFFPFY